MKTRKSLKEQLLFISSIFLLSSFVLIACHKDKTSTPTTNKMYTITGNASGAQVVPAVSDSGTATITGTFNQGTGMLTTTTSWTNLTGAPTIGAFYSGAPDSTGPIVGSAWALPGGLTANGSFNDTMTLSAAQAAQLTAGNWYYQLGTTANPNGEVRGQITATAQ
jgi:CHRD domain